VAECVCKVSQGHNELLIFKVLCCASTSVSQKLLNLFGQLKNTNGPKADPGGKVLVAIAHDKTYKLFHHDFVQFGKQHSLYIAILSFIVLGLYSVATSVSMCFACHFKITWDFAILVYFCVFLVCH